MSIAITILVQRTKNNEHRRTISQCDPHKRLHDLSNDHGRCGAGVIPTEAQEAQVLVSYLRLKGYKFTHIPNETGSSQEARRRAVRMKQQGTSKGFPDYLIITKAGLIAIELKRRKGSRITPEQLEWLDALNTSGTFAAIAHGAAEAIEIIELQEK